MDGAGASGKVDASPPASSRSATEHGTAVRILDRYGGDRSSAPRTAAAVERFFSTFQRRYAPLFGRDGYRTLVEQGHLRAVRDHLVLEKWPVCGQGRAFFQEPCDIYALENPVEFWEGAAALIGHFLGLLNHLARWGEMDGLDGAGLWEETGEASGPVSASTQKGTRKRGTRSPKSWRILVMDRDLTTCEAIAASLDEAPDFQAVDYGRTADEVRSRVEAGDIDFVIASGHLPSEELLRVCRWCRVRDVGKRPSVVISGLPEDYGLILRFLEAGAAAVTLEGFSVQGLRMNIRLLARGEAILPLRLQHLMSLRLSELAELVRDRGLDPNTLSSLTARETEVLRLLEQGLTNQQIARRLHLSHGTVKSYVHQILGKLKVRNRKEAVSVLRLARAVRPRAGGLG